MIFRKTFFAVSLIAGFIFTGCSTFITDEEIDRIKLKYQGGAYLLLQDIERNDVTLAKGTVVKLTVVPGEEWIKFYAYDTREPLLSSNRLILIFLFKDDFSEKEYDGEFLDRELTKLVKPLGEAEQPKGVQNKTGKK